MRILISPNPSRDENFKVTRSAAEVLSGAGAEVMLPDFVKSECDLSNITYYTGDIHDYKPDIVVAVGGDGTLLKAAREAVCCGSPVIGINLGNLGFLTGIDPCGIDKLKMLLTGEYIVEKRMMLELKILRENEIIYSETALNDCVISRGLKMRTIPLSLFSDCNEIKAFYGDGVVIATPTGSTAYSMSAGGPIVDPDAECIVVTPICPHALYAKSFVLEKGRAVRVNIGSLEQRDAWLSADGLDAISLKTGDIVTVKKSEKAARIIKLESGGFFERLRNKLAEK